MASNKNKLVKRRWGSPSAWFKQHRSSAVFSLRHLGKNPIGNLMTITVIAIALALPSGLRVLVSNFENLSGGWQVSAQLSLYLNADIDEAQIAKLQTDIGQRADVVSISALTADEALAEFKAQSGFADALAALDSNPLPAVITVIPTAEATKNGQIETLRRELSQLEGIDTAQLDRAWLERLEALIHVANRGIWVISILLVLAVWLIIGNTIRLDIENRRQEIEIAKLIGATNAFVRRPFLYTGLIYGTSGAFGAICLVNIAVWLLQGPTSVLAQLYGMDASAQALNLIESSSLLLLGGLLGLIGAWLSVGRHLKFIEPS